MTVEKIYNLTDHWFPDKIGGSCLYAFKLHQLLSRRAPIESVTLRGEPSDREQGMRVHKILSKSRLGQNRKRLRSLSDDANTVWIVHSPWFFLHLFLAFGFKVRRRAVAVYHGPWYREYFVSAGARKSFPAKLAFTLPRYAVELLYALFIKRFIFLSETMYAATAEYLPVSRSKTHIVPMWSDRPTWDSPRPRNERPILTTFRRLEPRMGLQNLLASLARCDLEDFQLIICGDGPYRQHLTDLVRQSGLGERVELRGWVSEREKLRLIRRSDAVIIPSRSLEGFSLLALEALEQGTPVVLTEAVGFYEYVRDLDQDFVKCIDLNSATLELREFLSLGDKRRGLRQLQAAFDGDKVGQQLWDVLTESIAGEQTRERSMSHQPK